MSKESYTRGFVKAAQAMGVDPVQLAKYANAAPYKPIYATQHQIGTLKDNWKAARNWYRGYMPGINSSFATVVDNNKLKHDMASLHAPTFVDRLHNGWNWLTGKGNIYGTTDQGKSISPQQYDAIIQSYSR